MTGERVEDKKSDVSVISSVHQRTSQTPKAPLKLFRPYELDGPETKPRQVSSSSPPKKSISSPPMPSNNASTMFEENRPPSSSSSSSTSSLGREKQLFSSLGLVQPPMHLVAEKNSIDADQSQSSPSVSPKSDVESEKLSGSEEKNQPDSTNLKRKSIFNYPNPNKTSSHRKQFKVKRIPTNFE